jgi:hypothetical protein
MLIGYCKVREGKILSENLESYFFLRPTADAKPDARCRNNIKTPRPRSRYFLLSHAQRYRVDQSSALSGLMRDATEPEWYYAVMDVRAYLAR